MSRRLNPSDPVGMVPVPFEEVSANASNHTAGSVQIK